MGQLDFLGKFLLATLSIDYKLSLIAMGQLDFLGKFLLATLSID